MCNKVVVANWTWAVRGLALVAFMLPAPSFAQLARIHVTRAVDGQPVAGAMVSLAHLNDTSIVARLTDASGVTVLRASASGRYRLIARRIGYKPSDTTVSISSDIDVALALIDVRAVLNPIVIKDKSSCMTTGDAGQRVFQLWDAVRNALEINRLTESQRLVRMEIEEYERDLAQNMSEQFKRIKRKQEATRQPFAAASPQYLESAGYVSTSGGMTYFAPDARTLLSDEFARSHCFSMVPANKNEKTFVGLAFSPTKGRPQPDVSGVLWLDASTLALHHLVFHYVNDPSPIRTEGSGGRVDFAQLGDGAWIIPRWYIRTPRLGQMRRTNSSLGRIEVTDTLLGFRESGALAHELVLGERRPLAVTQDASFSKGDRLSAVPLRSPELICADSNAATKAIRLYGRVSNPSGVLDPSIRLLVSWSKPNLYVIGRKVATAQQGQLIEVQPDSDGRYALCSLPVGQTFTLEVKRGLAKLDEKRIVAPDTTARIEMNFRTGPAKGSSTNTLANATLVGTVLVEGTANEGVNDAEIIIADLRTRTDSQGHFRLDGILRNSQTIRIRRLGFLEYEEQADFSERDRLSAYFFLKRIDRKVDTIVVESTKPQMGMEEFEYRRAHGFGSYVTRRELAKHEDQRLSEILGAVSGLNVIRIAGGAAAIATARSSASLTPRSTGIDASDRKRGARAACYSQVFLDGVRVFAPGLGQPLFDINTLTPQGIEGIEYYRSPAETPAQYSSTDAACGTLLIWTRRGSPEVSK